MSEYKMLGEFVHHCTKCGLDLNHRITLMDGETPARVLCLTCYTERSYRDPHREPRRPAAVRPATTQDIARVRQSHEAAAWQEKLADKTRTPHSYGINLECALDDHVYHPTFGLGLVIGFAGEDKVQIYFPEPGVKLLKGRKVKQAEKKISPLLLR